MCHYYLAEDPHSNTCPLFPSYLFLKITSYLPHFPLNDQVLLFFTSLHRHSHLKVTVLARTANLIELLFHLKCTKQIHLSLLIFKFRFSYLGLIIILKWHLSISLCFFLNSFLNLQFQMVLSTQIRVILLILRILAITLLWLFLTSGISMCPFKAWKSSYSQAASSK